jgi:Rrf2 family protein
MAYSTALSQGVSILLYIHVITEEKCQHYLSTKLISEQLNIPAPTTVKLLRSLSAARITIAKEGAKGGILLARPLSEVTMLDVFLALEHGKDLFKIHTDVAVRTNTQQLEEVKQKIKNKLQAAEQAMLLSLQEVKLIDLLT